MLRPKLRIFSLFPYFYFILFPTQNTENQEFYWYDTFITIIASKVETIAVITILFSFQFYLQIAYLKTSVRYLSASSEAQFIFSRIAPQAEGV